MHINYFNFETLALYIERGDNTSKENRINFFLVKIKTVLEPVISKKRLLNLCYKENGCWTCVTRKTVVELV